MKNISLGCVPQIQHPLGIRTDTDRDFLAHPSPQSLCWMLEVKYKISHSLTAGGTARKENEKQNDGRRCVCNRSFPSQ